MRYQLARCSHRRAMSHSIIRIQALHDSNRTSASTGHPTPVDDGTPAGIPTPAGEPPRQAGLFHEDDDPAGHDSLFSDDDGLPVSGAADDDAGPDESGSDDSVSDEAAPAGDALGEGIPAAIGRLVLSWGQLEHSTAEKLAAMRHSFGDVRAVGGRARPTIQKLLAELRALVAMRDRHDKQALTVIAEIDGALQRLAQFRLLIVEGGQAIEGEALICRDLKNGPHLVAVSLIEQETARIREITERIETL